jgi:hypothetical protein
VCPVLPTSLDCPFLTAPSFFSSVCFFWSLYCLFYGFWIFLWNLQTFWYTCYVFIYSIVHAKGDKQNINDCTKCSRLVIRHMYTVGNFKMYWTSFRNRWKARFWKRTKNFILYQQCTCIMLNLKCQKIQTACQIFDKTRGMHWSSIMCVYAPSKM